MQISDRIRKLRKEHLKLSQEKFGAQLGVSRDVIKNLELNLLARPAQKEPLLKLICSTYGVDENWLRTGEGDMLIETNQTILSEIAEKYHADEEDLKILEIYLKLPAEQRKLFRSLVKNIANNLNPIDESEKI